jgi:hypothetical protein
LFRRQKQGELPRKAAAGVWRTGYGVWGKAFYAILGLIFLCSFSYYAAQMYNAFLEKPKKTESFFLFIRH